MFAALYLTITHAQVPLGHDTTRLLLSARRTDNVFNVGTRRKIQIELTIAIRIRPQVTTAMFVNGTANQFALARHFARFGLVRIFGSCIIARATTNASASGRSPLFLDRFNVSCLLLCCLFSHVDMGLLSLRLS
jgi:hypothetical protein